MANIATLTNTKYVGGADFFKEQLSLAQSGAYLCFKGDESRRVAHVVRQEIDLGGIWERPQPAYVRYYVLDDGNIVKEFRGDRCNAAAADLDVVRQVVAAHLDTAS